MEKETIIKNVILSSAIEGNTIDNQTINDIKLLLDNKISVNEAIDNVSKRYEEKCDVKIR